MHPYDTHAQPFPAGENRAAPDWLATRGQADARAREAAAPLLTALAEHLQRRCQPGEVVNFIDLGAGAGANHRYLTPRLRAVGVTPAWTVVDHDQDLLNDPAHGQAHRVLGTIAEVDAVIGALAEQGGVVITCAALLDVLRLRDLQALVAVVCEHRVPALFSLSVSGRVDLQPQHEADALITAAFNAHQQRSGRLGADAASVLAELIEQADATVDVRSVLTAWLLESERDFALLQRYLSERLDAALEQQTELRDSGADWLATRQAQLKAGDLRVRADHVDLLLLPA